jgi:hypothetical protein
MKNLLLVLTLSLSALTSRAGFVDSVRAFPKHPLPTDTIRVVSYGQYPYSFPIVMSDQDSVNYQTGYAVKRICYRKPSGYANDTPPRRDTLVILPLGANKSMSVHFYFTFSDSTTVCVPKPSQTYRDSILIFTTPQSVGRIDQAEDLKLVPNPSSGKVQVLGLPLGIKLQCHAFDAVGRQIAIQLAGNTLQFPSTAPGYYWIIIRTADKQWVRKVLIER